MSTITDLKTGEVSTNNSVFPAHIPLSNAPLETMVAAANALGDPNRVKSEADIAKVLEEEVARASSDAPPPASVSSDDALAQRLYMEAFVRYATGQIDELSDDELRDVVCVIPKKAVPFNRWKELRGLNG